MVDLSKSPEQGLSRHWGLLIILCAGGFTSALNVTMLSPVLVHIADQFNISEAAAGQLATLTAASSGVTAVIVAPWIDRYPRGFWLRLECGLLAIGTIISAIAPNIALMFAGRALAGIGGAVIGANCLAACGDLFPVANDRNRAIGLINTAFTLGAVVGLPLITLLADWTNWRLAILLPAPIALIVFAASARLPVTSRPTEESLWSAWRAGYRRVFRSTETVWLLASVVMLTVVWFGWLIYFGAFTENVYATSAALLSALFLVGGGGEIVANNAVPILTRFKSTASVGYVVIAMSTINLLMMGIAWNQEWSLFPFVAIASGTGAMLLVVLNIAILDSLPGDPGAAMSLQSACFELGGSLGVAITGLSLALIDNYETVYRLLGAITPLIGVTLWLSTRSRVNAKLSAPIPTDD